ncbi:MAG: fasciclin domain-containing protein [Chitinophagaceae bacterium]|nr:MAG: fasciclin domain-containing protein [Chitinophagaceae bacterium]
MKQLKNAALLLTGIVLSFTSIAQGGSSMKNEKTVMVGGAAMYPSKTIVENAINSADHTTLVAAVKAAGLVETLQSAGPFTVFAPTNAAFAALPAGTVETLVKPENKATLTSILTYHVVAGRLDSKDLEKKMRKSKNGTAELMTVQGARLWIMKDSAGKWWVKDEKGNTAQITIANVYQSNGVIHVIDKVLMP